MRSLYRIIKIIFVLLILFNPLLPLITNAETANLEEIEEKTETDFYIRVRNIYEEELEKGSKIDLMVFAGTIHISIKYANMTYPQFDNATIKQLFKYMNSEPNIEDDEIIIYNEEAFRKNIKQYWIDGEHFSKSSYSEEKKEQIVDEIYDNIDEYKYFFGIEEDTSTSGGICSYNVDGKSVSNIKVRLMYCDGSGPIESEELIDFEEYIVGVVSQENGNGPHEALKAQAVAARSYALNRPSKMGNALGTSLEYKDGSWILSLRSCTNDQVFCNPTKGCWSNVKGGQTSNSDKANWKNCTVYSGYDTSKNWTRGPLAEDSRVRQAVEETAGQVAVDKNGAVVYTPYLDTNQKLWNSLAKEGKDYFEILKKDYDSISTITSNCTSTEGNSEAITWKQYDSRWGGIYIGTKTIKQVGCMLTSTAIQIARSGTQLTVSEFDPGVFVKTVKANNGLSGNNFNVNDSSWESIAPNFKVGGVIEFSGSRSDKINKMKQYITGNNYLIIRLYHPGQHWVAITSIEDDKIIMADPGNEATDFESRYSISTVTKGYYFVKND